MISRFSSFQKSNKLWYPKDRIVFAVSGGVDSSVMLNLFVQAGIEGIIAHCNFNLRESESDKDEIFVKSLGEKYDIPVLTTTFNTREYAKNNGISLQMAARDLRYDWFEEIRVQNGCDFIATAHNKNDLTETFFINLVRGSGIRGLTGIKEKSGRLIRPLLFAGRDEILEFAVQRGLEWREDSSNASQKYARNKIRHAIVPSCREINPRFDDIMIENMKRLRAVEDVFTEILEEKKKQLLIRDKNSMRISIQEIVDGTSSETWLYEILKDFGFSQAVIRDIGGNLHSRSGKMFYSLSHRLIKDRSDLIIEPLREEQSRKYYIENPLEAIDYPIRLDMSIEEIPNGFRIPPSPDTAWLDLDKLIFPLIIRKWEKGDYFQPLGMKNMKKLSDFFIDNKLSISQKEQTWILTSEKNIVWVMGLRIDERFKISPETKRSLRIRME